MIVHGFDENGSIIATIEGLRWVVPNAGTNRHRAMIAEWEAKGNTIPPYVASAVPTFVNLKPYQFWTAVRATGHESDLQGWVAQMSDPVARSYASSVLQYSLEFRYDHPLMAVALQVLGLSVEEFQTLWLWAADL